MQDRSATTSTVLYLLMPACAILNLATGSIVYLLKFPLYLDHTGTLLLALLIGKPELRTFLYSAGAGVLSFIIGGVLYNPYLPWFSGTAVAVAACATFILLPLLTRFLGQPISTPFVVRVLIGGIMLGLISALISLPIVVYLFGGVTGSGSAFIVAYLQATGQRVLSAAFWTGILVEPIDKTIQLAISLALLVSTPAILLQRARQ